MSVFDHQPWKNVPLAAMRDVMIRRGPDNHWALRTELAAGGYRFSSRHGWRSAKKSSYESWTTIATGARWPT